MIKKGKIMFDVSFKIYYEVKYYLYIRITNMKINVNEIHKYDPYKFRILIKFLFWTW